MTRRARNEGNIRKRSDGRYEVRVTDPLTGKRRSLFARTEKQAVDRLRAAQRSIEDSLPMSDGRTTVESFLAGWLETRRSALRPTTYRRYETAVRVQIVPHIGKVRLRALTPAHLRKLYATLERTPNARRRDKRPLAARTIGQAHRVLHAALEEATRDGTVPRNVAGLVTPPRPQHAEMRTLDGHQVSRLLEAADSDRLGAIYALAVTTGARLGELLGLRWTDVDLEAGVIQIRRSLVQVGRGELTFQEPKTTRSRRRIVLSQVATAALREHRQRQLAERMRAIAWEDQGLVFPNQLGRPMNPSNFNHRSWHHVRERAGLPRELRFHDLRHTAASLALAAGIPVPVVSEMLGHGSAAMTLNVYAHAVPGSQKQAADAFDRLLQGAS